MLFKDFFKIDAEKQLSIITKMLYKARRGRALITDIEEARQAAYLQLLELFRKNPNGERTQKAAHVLWIVCDRVLAGNRMKSKRKAERESSADAMQEKGGYFPGREKDFTEEADARIDAEKIINLLEAKKPGARIAFEMLYRGYTLMEAEKRSGLSKSTIHRLRAEAEKLYNIE